MRAVQTPHSGSRVTALASASSPGSRAFEAPARRATHGPSLRTAAALWILVGIAASVHVVLSPEHHSLWPVFRDGALGWWSGADIYASANYFRYSPAFAVLLVPLAKLPAPLGNLLFDCGGLALLFHAIRRLARVVFPGQVLSRNEPAVLLLSLLGVVRSLWSSQAHTWAAAFVFLAAAALVEQRWWVAAFALALAVHLKLAPIVLALVVAACWPGAMAARLAVAIAAFVPLPLLRGGPERTAALYRRWADRLVSLSATRFPSFRDLRHIVEVLGGAIPARPYLAIQAIAGAAVLLWSVRLRRSGADMRWVVSGVFALSIVYLLVLGPAVEFTQYPLLAPWVSAAFLAGWPGVSERVALGLVYLSTTVCGFGAVEDVLSALFGSRAPESQITLGTLAFGLWVVLTWRMTPRPPVEVEHSARRR
jgi:hypothetical protein